MNSIPSTRYRVARVGDIFRVIVAIVATISAAVVCLSAEPCLAQTQVAPSFDCSKAMAKVELMICNDPALESADALMARLFAAVPMSAFGKGLSNEGQAQRKWLQDRSTACTGLKPAEQPPCLLEFLDKRNEDLAVAALFTKSDLALDTLHRLDPSGAPLIEAVYLYASEAPGGDWSSAPLASKRQRLLGLLQPYALRFVTDDELSFGRDILKDEGVASADDALKTEQSFASFVAIASAYIPDGPVPRAIPCAALVRHPKLIEMEGPVFGSTLDNFVVSADCRDTLPPTPQLTRLANQINDKWPECEGTIRFAAYRSFETAIDAALLATGSDLRGKKPRRIPRLTGVSPQLVQAAIAELTAYYREYGRATERTAPALAEAMIRDIMTAGHNCG